MNPKALDEVVSFATNQLGERLRAVGYATESSLEYVHLRDDVAQLYDDTAIDRIKNELVLSTLEHAHHQELFAVGGLRATFRVFDDAIIVSFDDPAQNGAVIVSFDANGESVLVEFVDACRDLLEVDEPH